MADNITLKIDADVSDAQSAIAKFQKTTEKAFNSSNTKIQQTGNQLNNLTHNLDRVAGKMKQLENTRFKTEEYKKLESNISKVGNEITKTETKVKKLADKKIPTTEYLNLKDRVKDLGTEIKTTESELKKWEKSDVFKATEKDVASLTRKYSEATVYAQKLLKGGVKSYDNQYIEAKNNVKALGKELRQAKAYQQSLIDSGKQYKNQNEYEQKSNKLKILKGELVAVQQQMKSMEVTGKASTNTLEYEQLKDRLEDLRLEYKQLNEEKALLDRTGAGTYSGTQTTQYQSLQDQYTGLYNRASMVNNKINEMNKGTIQVMSSTQLVRTAVDSVKSAWRTVINIVKVGVKGITTAFKSWATSAKNSIRSVSNMFTSLFNRSVGNSTKYHNNSFKSMITMLLKYAFGIRSIFLLYKKVRSTISTGLTEMGKEFSDVQADINSLKNSWATFKSSLISAFQPIYSYVVPALVTLINYLTSAMNALANFFAIMTGKSTYKKAVQQNEDYASSVSDTGNAAKDANEELAEYDDLIVISQDTSSSGSGGSGSGADTGWQWEEVPTTTNSTIEAIKNAWKNADWEGLGEIISNKLTEMMNRIPWNTIYQKAENFGTGLAQFLNGLITDDLFSALGTTIANALNTALISVNAFAKTFKWDDLGTAIASGIEAFFKSFKLSLAVETFNNLANGILTTIDTAIHKLIKDGFFNNLASDIAGAIGKVDTSGFGAKLGSIANGIANAVYQLVSNKDTWKNLGTKISDGINAFLTSMNTPDKTTGKTGWEALGGSISSSISGIATTLRTAIEGISTDDIKTGFKQLIEGINWQDTAWDLGKLINSLANRLYELVSDKSSWSKLGEKLGEGIKGFFEGLSDVDSKTGLTGWQAIGETIGSTISGIVTAITEALKKLTAKDYQDIGKGIVDVFKSAIGALQEADWKGFKDACTNAIKNILKGMDIDGSDIALTLTGVALTILAISAINFAKTVTIAALTKLAETALITHLGASTLTLGSVLSATAKVAVVIAVAIASWKLGNYVYKKVTGDNTDYGSPAQQLKECIQGALSGDLVNGIKLDWNGDKKITFDLANVYMELIGLGMSPIEWLKKKLLSAFLDKIGVGQKLEELEINLSDIIKKLIIKVGDYSLKLGEKITSFKDKLKQLIFGDSNITDTDVNDDDSVLTASVDVLLKKKGWDTVSKWVSTFMGDGVSSAVSLAKNFGSKINTVSQWLSQGSILGTGVSGAVGLITKFGSGIGTVSQWLNQPSQMGGGATAPVTLTNKKDGKSLWKTVADWIKNVKSKGKMNVTSKVKLETQGGWKSVQDWVGSGGSVTTKVNLTSDWTSVAGWCVGHPDYKASQLSAATSYLNVWVNLKQGTNTVDKGSFTYKGGSISRYGGPLSSWFASGGSIQNGRVASWWNNIPKYAGGTTRPHGTMFVAGEAGPEVVGHINNRTEILNKSQLASAMYSAIIGGMQTVLARMSSINLNLDFTPLLNGLASIPIPVVVTGQVLPANEEFMRNREEERTRLNNIENLMYNILDKLDDNSSNHPPIMLKLDSRTVAEAVWDETEKRYKQTGRRYSFG